jgi:hypothetical protein
LELLLKKGQLLMVMFQSEVNALLQVALIAVVVVVVVVV